MKRSRGLVVGVSLLMVGFVWGMGRRDVQGMDQRMEVPGRFNEVVCMICRDDFRDLGRGRVAVVFPCGHWVCSACRQNMAMNTCPACRGPVPTYGQGGVTPLHDAADQGDADRVRGLIEGGANVHAVTPHGDTPLHMAGTAAVVRALVEGGAQVNAVGRYGLTPLHCVAMRSNVEAVRELMRVGARVNARTHNRYTPLHRAGTGEIARVLIAAGANVDAVTNDGYTPLHLANTRGVARVLIAKGARVNAVTSDGYTSLHEAARHGNTGVVEALLEADANPDAVAMDGTTPLQMAGTRQIRSLLEAYTNHEHEALMHHRIWAMSRL